MDDANQRDLPWASVHDKVQPVDAKFVGHINGHLGRCAFWRLPYACLSALRIAQQKQKSAPQPLPQLEQRSCIGPTSSALLEAFMHNGQGALEKRSHQLMRSNPARSTPDCASHSSSTSNASSWMRWVAVSSLPALKSRSICCNRSGLSAGGSILSGSALGRGFWERCYSGGLLFCVLDASVCVNCFSLFIV